MKEDEASSTSLIIATAICFLGRTEHGASLVPPESLRLCDWLLGNYSPFTRRVLRSLDWRWTHLLIRGLESATIPHIIEHYLQRKKALEVLYREHKEAKQLVVLGAGFDSLAARMAGEFPECRAWEIDHPATQIWKRKSVEACGLDSPRLNFLALDLSRPRPMAEEILGPAFHRNEAAFWIAEGLLMYFPEHQVKELFRSIRAVSAPRSRFAFTFMEPQDDGRVDFRRRSRSLKWWLKHHQEPFAWGIRRQDLPSFLDGLGYRLIDIPSAVTREIDRLHVGEYLALAEIVETS